MIFLCTLTVTRDVEGITGAIPLPIDRISFMEYEKPINRIIVHTLDETFYTVGTLKFWTNSIEGAGYDFVLADRNTAINISMIVQIDTGFRIAYFESASIKGAKKCLLSGNGLTRVLENLDRSIVKNDRLFRVALG